MSRRRPELPCASSRTDFDTPTERRCNEPRVGFAGVMQLLGHKSPHMTLGYLEITQPDLQREFHLARSHPRHWAPSRALCSASPPRADLVGLIDSLETAQHVLEMYRRNVADNSARRLLDRLANRIVKILAETRRLNKPQE